MGVNGDVKKLKKDYNIDTFGAVDLNDVNADKSKGTQLSLEKLARLIIDEPMQYKHAVDHDQWEADTLDVNQIHYAADDAFIAFKILKEIIRSQNSQTTNIMELCFGKIDTHLGTASKKKKKKRTNHGSDSAATVNRSDLKSNNNYIQVVLPNAEPLTFVPTKLAKMFLRKHWATKQDASTIRMAFVPGPIDAQNKNMFKYIRLRPRGRRRVAVALSDAALSAQYLFEKPGRPLPSAAM